MRAYQYGKRGHATMGHAVKVYSDKDLKNFAAYYARLGKGKGMQSPTPDAPTVASTCEPRHGSRGRAPVNPDGALLAGREPSFFILKESHSREHSPQSNASQSAAGKAGASSNVHSGHGAVSILCLAFFPGFRTSQPAAHMTVPGALK